MTVFLPQRSFDFRQYPFGRERTGKVAKAGSRHRRAVRHIVDDDDRAELRERPEDLTLRLVHHEEVERAMRRERDRVSHRRRLEQSQIRPLAQTFPDVAPEVCFGGDDEYR